MRVKKTEKIIIDWKEKVLWNDFENLINEIHTEVDDDELFLLVNEMRKIMTDLEDYLEVE